MNNYFVLTILTTVFSICSYASDEKIVDLEVSVYTQSSKPEEIIKRYEKANLYHTGNELNKRLTNVKASLDRSNNSLNISFDYPTKEWSITPSAYPLIVRYADSNGQVLGSFYTGEDFVPKSIYLRTKPGTFARAHLDDRPQFNQKKAFLLEEKDNQLGYTINARDAAFVKIIEIGFDTTSDRRTSSPIPEFMPKDKFVYDWSKNKVFGLKAPPSKNTDLKKYKWQYYPASNTCNDNKQEAMREIDNKSGKIAKRSKNKIIIKTDRRNGADYYYTSKKACDSDLPELKKRFSKYKWEYYTKNYSCSPNEGGAFRFIMNNYPYQIIEETKDRLVLKGSLPWKSYFFKSKQKCGI